MQTIFNDRMDTKKLRQKILDLAIHGKLVPQDPNDEPASVLLERIRAEKERLIAEGKIKRSKKSATSDTSHYENVPFEVPEGWTKCCLYDIVSADCTLGYGIVQPMDDINDGVPVVRPVDLTTQIIRNNGLKRIDPTISEAYQRTILKGGEILFCVRASVGKLGIASPELKGANVTRGISPIRFDYESLTKYVFYHLQSFFSQNEIKHYSRGATLQQINVEDLKKLSIALPPLDEQKRIVNELEQWLQVCDIIEDSETKLMDSLSIIKNKILDLAIHGKLVPQDANDEPATELLKRINPKAIASCDNPHYVEPYDLPDGWIWCKLMDLCTFLSRGKSPKYSERDTTYPVFAQKCNLKEGGISLENARFLEPTSIDRWPDVYHLQTGDVLVNSTGTGTVGRTRLFNESCLGSYPFVVPDSHVSVVRTHSDIVSEYIFALMSSSWIQAYLENNLAGSTNQKELYIGVLQNVDVPLPPIMEQKRIADKIETLYQQLDGIANHIE